MAFFLIRDVFRRIAALARFEFCAMHFELMGVDHKVIEAVALFDVRFDSNSALVRKVTAKLNVVDRDVVVRRFGPVPKSDC